MPLLVFAFPYGMTQAWYETVSPHRPPAHRDDLFGYTFRVVQIPSFIKRYVLGRLAKSQAKLDKCWEPRRTSSARCTRTAQVGRRAARLPALFPPLYLLGDRPVSAFGMYWPPSRGGGAGRRRSTTS